MSTDRYSIRPIPTRYDGYSFRSRLEARWAVFYKTLGLPYRYETEGYVVNGVKYLADFYFPTQDEKGLAACYIEIKPTEPTPEEEYKAEWLHNTLASRFISSTEESFGCPKKRTARMPNSIESGTPGFLINPG